jgi:uncharacterized protein (TIGR03545 family)
MLKWIRPSGALGFLVVFLAVSLFWWLLADWLLKVSIEKAGTKIVGAKVELAAADLTFSPLGFRLDRLQVTDPQQPMRNLFELSSAKGNLELLPLLMGQVIVDEMSATGVRFHTERTRSGAIEKPKTKSEQSEQKGQQADKPGINIGAIKDKLPSVDEIMAKEPLATLEKTNAFQTQIQTQRDELQQKVTSLPDEKTIKRYEQRLKETTGGNIQSVDELQRRQKELEKLKDEIRADRDALVSARNQIRSAKDQVNSQYKGLQQAPSQDWNHLKNRYGLNITGAGNVTQLLFGDSAATWLRRLLSWAGQINRILPGNGGEKPPEALKPARGEGRYVRFPASNPLPSFLVRKALLTLELKAGNLELSITDATHQPHILGRPMRLHASGKNLENADQIKFDGVIDHVKPANAIDSLQWSVSGWKLSNVAISKESNLPLTLTKARGNLSGNLELAGQNLSAGIDAAFKDTQWSSPSQEGWTGRVSKTITSVKQFNLDAKIQGNLSSPQMSLRSDLDEQLKQAVAGQLKTAQTELEQKLKARLNAEVEKTAGPYKDQLAYLTDTEGTVEQRIDQLDEMLKAELKSAVDSKKQEATDKLKDQLKGLKF